MIKIGNAGGFWGDTPSAGKTLLQQAPDLDYLTLDYLAEISLSIMAVQKGKNPAEGYAKDAVRMIETLLPYWKEGGKCKVITNGGGLNPRACAEAVKTICPEKKVGIVSGDDVLGHFSGQGYVTANAYLGASGIVEALEKGAEIVVTGRVADPSLTLAPCIHAFGWDTHDLLAQGTVAGHLIECGRQVTGGISTDWMHLPDPVNIPFPIVEVEKEGAFIVTKPENTGGRVTFRTVKEQLLYEIGDPGAYLSPDVTVSFLSLDLEQTDTNRIRVKGARGSSPPKSYKVSATTREGYKAEGFLALFGDEVFQKAGFSAAVFFERLKAEGISFEREAVELIGMGHLTRIPSNKGWYPNNRECVFRMAAADRDKEKVERFSQEIASLVTSGPQGVTGYTSGRPPVRPIFGYHPLKIDKNLVETNVEFL